MLLLSSLLYIRLIVHHIILLSGAQRNLTIFFYYKCSSYSSDINVQNYDSFWSYDKNMHFLIIICSSGHKSWK